MQKYIISLLLILACSIFFCFAFLIFMQINQYSSGMILNYNNYNFLTTQENKLIINEKKEIIVNKKNYLVTIITKSKEDDLYFYAINANEYFDTGIKCQINMGKESLILLLFHEIMNSK
ncbi:MAG: hypothetical protein ACRCW6_01355 [Mycoplasmoidaceae bacterium]